MASLPPNREVVGWRGFDQPKFPQREWFEAQDRYLDSLSKVERHFLTEYTFNEKILRSFVQNGFKPTQEHREMYAKEKILQLIAPTIDDLRNGLLYYYMTIMRVIALAPLTMESFVVFRGFNDENHAVRVEQDTWNAAPGLTSTSLVCAEAAKFGTNIMRIHVPAGIPTLYMENVSEFSMEKEVLLPCNCVFARMRGTSQEHAVELRIVQIRDDLYPNWSTPYEPPMRGGRNFAVPREPTQAWFRAQEKYVDSLTPLERMFLRTYLRDDRLYEMFVRNNFQVHQVHLDAFPESEFLHMIASGEDDLRDGLIKYYNTIQKILAAAPRTRTPFVVFREWKDIHDAFVLDNYDDEDEKGETDEGNWTPRPRAFYTTLDVISRPRDPMSIARITVPVGVSTVYTALLFKDWGVRQVLLPSRGKLRRIRGKFLSPQGYTAELEYVEIP